MSLTNCYSILRGVDTFLHESHEICFHLITLALLICNISFNELDIYRAFQL